MRRDVVRIINRRMSVQCLGVTKSGAPKHPLYVKGDTDLVPLWLA